MKRAVAVMVALALMQAPAAHGQPAAGSPSGKAEAEKRFQKAEALYQRREYLAAAVEYQAAYDQSGLPGLLYNVAQSYRLGGEKAKAAVAYRLFLERAPDHQLSAVARGHLEALERELAAEKPDTRPEPPEPSEPRTDVVTAAPTAPERGRGLRIAGLASAGVGLIGLGAALHYGIVASKASDAISRNDEAWSQSLLDRYDEGEKAETRMFILSGVGAAALAAGGVLYFLGWRASKAETVLSVAAPAGGSAAAITLRGSF